MLRNLTLVLFAISPLMAQSSAATTAEADRKAQLSQYQRLDNSWNPDDFNDTQLSEMKPWMLGIDERTITMSHRFDEQLGVIRRVSYPRDSFKATRPHTRWRSVVHSKAKRKLFD